MFAKNDIVSMKYYLVTTNHFSEKLLFKDDEDYKAGMNFTPLAARAIDVLVLAFILMSTHMHYVLRCNNKEEALAFITKLKLLYGGYFGNKYGQRTYLRRLKVDIQELDTEDEIPEWAIAYVLMNSVAAKISLDAAGYPWGSGACYFNQTAIRGTRLDNMSWRAIVAKVHSKLETEPGWIMADEGYIDPRSYIPVKLVEKLYGTPSRMMYFLKNSSKAKKRLETSAGLPAFSDKVVLGGVQDLCATLFGKLSPDSLADDEKTELVKQLQRRFSADIDQICRTTGISHSDAVRMLDSM